MIKEMANLELLRVILDAVERASCATGDDARNMLDVLAKELRRAGKLEADRLEDVWVSVGLSGAPNRFGF